MLKFAIFACSVLFVSCALEKTTINLPPELEADVWKALNICCINEQEIADITSIISNGECRDDQQFKTSINCIYKESGFVKEDGRLLIDKALTVFPDKNKMQTILTECDKDMGTIPEENIYKTFKCFQENSIYRIAIQKL